MDLESTSSKNYAIPFEESMDTPPPVQPEENILLVASSQHSSRDQSDQSFARSNIPIIHVSAEELNIQKPESQSAETAVDIISYSSEEKPTHNCPAPVSMEPPPSIASTTNVQETFVLVELLPPVPTCTNDSPEICVNTGLLTTGPNNETVDPKESLAADHTAQSKPVRTHSVLYRILKAPTYPENTEPTVGSEQVKIVNVELVEKEKSCLPCLSVQIEVAVCSDSSCSDEGGCPTQKWVHVRPFVKSQALQMRPHVRSRSVQAGRPLRKRKRLSSTTDVSEVTVPKVEAPFMVGASAPSCTLPPQPRKKRKVMLTRKRNVKTTAVRKRRIPDSEQCLEDLYDQIPGSRKSEIIPLCGYDRVSSICREPFETKDQWLADGFPKCFEICALIAQPVRLVIWLAQRRLIRNRSSCPQCPNPMLLKTALVDRHIYKWACRRCGRKLSIRHGSMFIKAGVSDPNIILILYLWSVGYPTDFLGTEIETSLSSVRWYIWLALKSCAAELRREFQPLQGVVELHWDVFLRPTDKREGLNLLCGVERNSSRVFAVRCPRDNDKNLLKRLIQNNIATGSAIITRDLHMYTQLNLPAMGYMHYVLDRTHELALDDFVIDLSQVDDFVHSIKSFLRKQGGPGLFCKEIFLAEMIVRRTWGRNLLPMVLYSISRAYDIS